MHTTEQGFWRNPRAMQNMDPQLTVLCMFSPRASDLADRSDCRGEKAALADRVFELTASKLLNFVTCILQMRFPFECETSHLLPCMIGIH